MDPYSRSLLFLPCAVEPLAFGIRDTSNLLRRGIYPLPSWMAGSGPPKSQKSEEQRIARSRHVLFFFPGSQWDCESFSPTKSPIEGPSAPIIFKPPLGQAPPGSRADVWLTGTLGETHRRGLAGWGLSSRLQALPKFPRTSSQILLLCQDGRLRVSATNPSRLGRIP
ncbi:uncharacterized protein BO72DRAFT_281045 [Aspergillus fijiensis CBS 313.89]|uniref:Uncharacterized protein n=1 Tax=Aspergillus fijiensis CBS 313.89 TaxID=1448319 RepID=A0A8G1W2B4_9EURO|nr:uncharacterized protein BO72DRAFT_281045 [Aspergillus fijiensis CBS 313.89]RAK80493.1 hypothetical protein BO72DRAFT_281045 [Aspergillus fijiensis CBS 313.89]